MKACRLQVLDAFNTTTDEVAQICERECIPCLCIQKSSEDTEEIVCILKAVERDDDTQGSQAKEEHSQTGEQEIRQQSKTEVQQSETGVKDSIQL